MQSPDHELLSEELAHQAKSLPVASAMPPVESLLSRHRKRVRRRRLLVISAVVAPLLIAVGLRIGLSPALDSTIDRVASQPTNQDNNRLDDGTDAPTDQQSWDELVKLISQQSGTQAKLVEFTDDQGVERRAIYVPQHVVPVKYENLSFAEQSAIQRVLNQSTDVIDSI